MIMVFLERGFPVASMDGMVPDMDRARLIVQVMRGVVARTKFEVGGVAVCDGEDGGSGERERARERDPLEGAWLFSMP